MNPFLDEVAPAAANPFAPPPPAATGGRSRAPSKVAAPEPGPEGLRAATRRSSSWDEVASAYCQFGPLTAYPRAQRTRELYPALPDAPLPAVITCIATTAAARGDGLGLRLVAAVCDDLEGRGFTAVEAYPRPPRRPDATSAATPAFWVAAGFALAVADERFPVMRRELA